MAVLRTIFLFVVFVPLLSPAANCQSSSSGKTKDRAPAPAEDISGMYTFLNNGEFLQINIEGDTVSGYISRTGDLESDRGTFLDQFFDKASISGHDVTFTTRILHGEWFEFKGRFERGHAKTKAEDGYYMLRGTLIKFAGDEKNPASSAHQVEFKWMAQPQDVEEKKPKSKSR